VVEAERCLDAGLRGIGEVAVYGERGGFLKGAAFGDLADLLEARKVPLLLHATESVGHSYPGKDRTDLQDLYQWIEEHPSLDIVLAHWGGGLFFYELMPEVREACRRVHYDTAASPFLYRPEIYSHALGIVGTDRILLGSDFPLLHTRRYLQEIRGLGLPEERWSGLLGGNAARLWKWEGKG
jgi:predicted TIM-barrel fold metal-dependent hydrolase